MRTRLLSVILGLAAMALPAFAQMGGTSSGTSPECVINWQPATASVRVIYDNRKQGCVEWTLFWSNNASVSGFSVELDGAADSAATPGVWSAMGAATGSANPATSGSSGTVGLAYGFSPWVSINVTSLSGAGASMSVMAIGYRPIAGTSAKRWAVTSAPAAGSQATVTKAAVSGSRHVVDCIGFSAAASSAPSATATTVTVTDNATGVWQLAVAVPASTGQLIVPSMTCGLNIVAIAAGTSMTISFGAGIANVLESVNMTGYDIQ